VGTAVAPLAVFNERRLTLAGELKNTRVAALVDNGFEQVELTEPKKALEQAGATVDIVSPQQSKVKPLSDRRQEIWPLLVS
jgi:DJ-1/PfpI family